MYAYIHTCIHVYICNTRQVPTGALLLTLPYLLETEGADAVRGAQVDARRGGAGGEGRGGRAGGDGRGGMGGGWGLRPRLVLAGDENLLLPRGIFFNFFFLHLCSGPLVTAPRGS